MSTPTPLLLLALIAFLTPHTDGTVIGGSRRSGIQTLAQSDIFRRIERKIRDLEIGKRSTYFTNDELYEKMDELAKKFPEHTYLYSIGESVQKTSLWVLAIAGSDPKKHVHLRPELKFVGNMHGNEVVGRELIIHYAQYLLESYASMSGPIVSLLDSARVHLMPTMNPDGFNEATLGDCEGIKGRRNHNEKDLNRNFPDFFDQTYNPTPEPETKSVMEWAHQYQFVLSANFHGGEIVANYPFDNSKDGQTHESASPDDDVFKHLATTYASHNPPMFENNKPPFRNGTTDGADWYALRGGMQDWMYMRAGCMELTLEISRCKYPRDYSEITRFWNDNRDSMTALLFQGLIGVKGVVVDWNGNPVAGAKVTVDKREVAVVKTTPGGEFWRLLLPGEYLISFEADCCKSVQLKINVPRPTSDTNAALVIPQVKLEEKI